MTEPIKPAPAEGPYKTVETKYKSHFELLENGERIYSGSLRNCHDHMASCKRGYAQGRQDLAKELTEELNKRLKNPKSKQSTTHSTGRRESLEFLLAKLDELVGGGK